MNEAGITITERPDLRLLMANEFHSAGSCDFAPQEPQNYLCRLTKEQCALLLSDRVPANHLTAFITFGDGFFDRPMGAYYDLFPGKDSIRPNASFALFFKQKVDGRPKISLVFYTRFFVISYGSAQNRHAIKARAICKQLDNNPGQVELKKKAFETMQKLLPRDCFVPLSRTNVAWKRHPPPRFGLFIEPKFRKGGFSYFPYILLKTHTETGWQTPTWFRGNTIHGIYNTRGCWMLTRNYVWNRPDENVGNTFAGLTNCYLAHNLRIEKLTRQFEQATQAGNHSALNLIKQGLKQVFESLASCAKFCLPAVHPIQRMPWIDIASWYLVKSRNFSYFQLINTFAGIRYNHASKFFPYYSPTVHTAESHLEYNCWKETSADEIAKLFYPIEFNNNKKNSFTEPWAYAFLFQRTDGHFTPDPGDQNTFK